MRDAWALDLPRDELLVLLALDDQPADVQGMVCASVALVAWKTGYGRRAVQMALRSLKARGVVVVARPGGGRRANTYRLLPEAGPRKLPFGRTIDTGSPR